MNLKKAMALVICVLMAAACFAQAPKGSPRGKAAMKAGSGSITIDYGRPSMSGPALKGGDPLSQFQVGQSWRMGSNQATLLTTPVELTFGSTKIAAGQYSLFLNRAEGDKFELVFNSQTGQWGMQHDVSKDIAKVAMKKEAISKSVDPFTIELKEAPNGGSIVLSWGTTQLSAPFQFAR